MVLLACSCQIDNTNKDDQEKVRNTPQDINGPNKPSGLDEKDKEKVVLEFAKEASRYVGAYFPSLPLQQAKIQFGLIDVNPDLPGGSAFFDNKTNTVGIFINLKFPLAELKPILLHEMVHVYQITMGGERLRKLKAQASYGLSDFNLARNILDEGQASYIENLWRVQNGLPKHIYNVEESLKDSVQWSPTGLNLKYVLFRYAFGYLFFEKLARTLSHDAFLKKSEELITKTDITTTDLFNEYLDIHVLDPLIIHQGLAKLLTPMLNVPADEKSYWASGAAFFIFYLASIDLSFSIATEELKKLTIYSGITSEKNANISFLSSKKPLETLDLFLKHLKLESTQNVDGCEVYNFMGVHKKIVLMRHKDKFLWLTTGKDWKPNALDVAARWLVEL